MHYLTAARAGNVDGICILETKKDNTEYIHLHGPLTGRLPQRIEVGALSKQSMAPEGYRHEFPSGSEIWLITWARVLIRGHVGAPLPIFGSAQSCREVGRRELLKDEFEDNKWPIRIVELATSHLTAMFMHDRAPF